MIPGRQDSRTRLSNKADMNTKARNTLLALLAPALMLPAALSAPAKTAAKPAAKMAIRPALTASGALPGDWRTADIGKVGVRGTAREAAGSWTISGAGEDIFGAADSFHYVWRPWHGDGSITARVVRYQRRDMWTKVGVMVRASTAAGSKFADVLVTPDKGAEMQWRTQGDGDTQTTDQVRSAAPFWVRLVRAGDTLTGYVSQDGRDWQPRGKATVALPAEILIGLCVTSHQNGALTEAVVDSVTVE